MGYSEKTVSMSPHRNGLYLIFVRRQVCCVSESPLLVVAHHVRMWGDGGVGLKPSDYLTVPLTSSEHAHLHQVGERAYWAERGINPMDVIVRTLFLYLRRERTDEGKRETAESLVELIEAKRGRRKKHGESEVNP